MLIVVILATGGVLVWQQFQEPTEEQPQEKECAGIGESKCDVMSCRLCCEGLEGRYIKTPMRNKLDEIVCVEEMTIIKCVKCGDGICGTGENWCVCPEDCEKPSLEDLGLYPNSVVEDGQTVEIQVFFYPEGLDFANRVFEAYTLPEEKDIKIIVTDATKFYSTADYRILEYFTLSEFKFSTGGGVSFPNHVKGTLNQEKTTIIANEIFSVAQ